MAILWVQNCGKTTLGAKVFLFGTAESTCDDSSLARSLATELAVRYYLERVNFVPATRMVTDGLPPRVAMALAPVLEKLDALCAEHGIRYIRNNFPAVRDEAEKLLLGTMQFFPTLREMQADSGLFCGSAFGGYDADTVRAVFFWVEAGKTVVNTSMMPPFYDMVQDYERNRLLIGFFLEQVCTAMEQAKAVGLLHLDSKAENYIWATRSGYSAPALLINDFDVSVLLPEQTAALGEPSYTPWNPYTWEYAAPEQVAEPQGSKTFASDLYAVALLCYTALNDGRQPAELGDTEEKRRRAFAAMRGKGGMFSFFRKKPPVIPPPANGSDALKAAVLRALSAEPSERGTVQDLKRAVQAEFGMRPQENAAPAAPPCAPVRPETGDTMPPETAPTRKAADRAARIPEPPVSPEPAIQPAAEPAPSGGIGTMTAHRAGTQIGMVYGTVCLAPPEPQAVNRGIAFDGCTFNGAFTANNYQS